MRILFVTNFYPPYELGGQGQSCQDVVEGMKQRGHHTAVLTSMWGVDNSPQETAEIHRCLYPEMDSAPWKHSLIFFTHRKKREKHNLRSLERILNQFKPDVVFIWGMWNLNRSLPAFIEAWCPGRVLYRFATYWPTLPSQHDLYWRIPGRTRFSRFPKRLLRRIALAIMDREPLPTLKFEHTMCVSAATRDTLVEAGIPISNARIIHTGLDITQYPKLNHLCDPSDDNQNLKLLYAGRLHSNKGVDTVIEAMSKLVFDQGFRNITLSLAGSGSADYEDYLRLLVTQAQLTNYVSFLGYTPREEMPALLRKYDVLVVPSIWPEPFARVILEGMISGLVVVATPTGGTGEIVVDGENGLLFAPGDAEDLARKIAFLVTNPELCWRLARTGRQVVKEKHTRDRMLDEIESYLQEIAVSVRFVSR